MSGNDISEKSSLTVRDIARLAGVSTATVSRVVNGSGTVSRKTKTNVLAAVSRLQYCPSSHASELGRQNGGIPRKRIVLVNASSAATAALGCRGTAGRLRYLQDENTRLRRQLADLTLQLETLKRPAESTLPRS
jgi:DNA-binding IclR family transcriptional regulator